LDQKYVWNQELGYFTENRKDGQPEVWHGVIDFDQDIEFIEDETYTSQIVADLSK